MSDEHEPPVQTGERLLIPREYVTDIVFDDDPDPPPKTPPPRGPSPLIKRVL